jgi:exodeoxyribonuclease VII small subunit
MNKKKSFEESVQRLEKIVSELENSEIKLDDMLELYQEGSELIKVCLTKLDDVEKKISVLSTGSSGEIEEQPLEKE